jgi:glycine betaine catabolism A
LVVVVPAPIDRRLLEPCLAPWPQSALTLPREAYLDADVFAWERKLFFEAAWFCAGRSADLSEPGDQRAVRIGDEGILLVRGGSGELRGFYNTCRHRGHELLPCGGQPQNEKTVRCPYHRWMYDLDGSFKGGPNLAGQPGFDRNDPDHSLIPARVEEWAGFVFVNANEDAAPLVEHLGTLMELAAPYEMERLFIGASHSYDLDANWKVIVENYHECYHCSEIHPELCAVSLPGSGQDWEPDGVVIGGSMELVPKAQTMSLDGKSLGVPFRSLQGSQLREVYYLELFPNVLLSLHPDYVMVHRLEPLAADKTRVECMWLFPPEARDHAGFHPAYAVDFWDITNRQDWAACESVQRGITGRGYRQSQFSQMERVVHQAMAMVARGYLEGGVKPVHVAEGALGRS